jgi:CheY-like chemotaxis protein
VLAVDDEADALNLLRSVLESAGATVIVANSAPAALEVLRAQVPDVIVADIGMPGMDGLQLVRAIRQMEGRAQSIPAAALSAYARSQDRIASLASGFQMHLVKPIDPVELLVAVATLGDKRLRA